MRLDLGADVLVRLLDQRRRDPPVGDQPLEREAGDLAAHAVEAREQDGGGRLVDDEVDAGELLEHADVAAVAADDPALHLVAGQLDQAGRRLAGVPRRETLHRDREDAPRAALGLALGLLLDLHQAQARLMASLLLDLGQQQLLGLRRAEARDPLQLAPLHPLLALQLLALLGDVSLAVVQGLGATLQSARCAPSGL